MDEIYSFVMWKRKFEKNIHSICAHIIIHSNHEQRTRIVQMGSQRMRACAFFRFCRCHPFVSGRRGFCMEKEGKWKPRCFSDVLQFSKAHLSPPSHSHSWLRGTRHWIRIAKNVTLCSIKIIKSKNNAALCDSGPARNATKYIEHCRP